MQSVLQKSSSFKNRQSGIELLKITAIFLIILSHVLNTLFTMTDQYPVINFITSTTDLGQFILIVLRHAGAFGNLVFFVSSAWFLLEKKHFNKKKEMFLIADTWFISVIILAAFLVAERGDMGLKSIVKNLFPITFGNKLVHYVLYYFLPVIICFKCRYRKARAKTALVDHFMHADSLFWVQFCSFWAALRQLFALLDNDISFALLSEKISS